MHSARSTASTGWKLKESTIARAWPPFVHLEDRIR
jgi:hypothetical protein